MTEEKIEQPAAEESSVTAPVNPLERTVEFTVSQEAVTKSTEASLKNYAKKARVDGFRRGHVPMNIVRQMYGQEAYGEALNKEIGQAVEKLIADGNYRIAGTPEVVPAESAAEGNELKFAAKFEVLPEVAAPDFAALNMKRFVCEVTEENVNETLRVMRKQRAEYKDAARAAAKEDKVTVDFEGKLDGEAFEGGSAKGFIFELGSGQMLPEFDAAATGMSAGETKTFKLTFPADYNAKNLAGKETEFTITMVKVEEPVLPALDDEFAKSLGITGGVAELTKEVENNLNREVKARLTARTKEGVFNTLLDACKFDIPQVMVRDESARIAEEYRQNLAARGLDVKNIPALDPAVFASQAERRVHLGLLVSKLIADNKIQATPEQVKAFAAEMAAAYDDPEGVTQWYLNDPQRYSELSAAVIENNLIDFVLSKTKTVDESIAFDKLMGRSI